MLNGSSSLRRVVSVACFMVMVGLGLALLIGPGCRKVTKNGLPVAEVKETITIAPEREIYILGDGSTLPVTVLRPVRIRAAVHKENGNMEEWDVMVLPGALVVPPAALNEGK